GAALRRRAVKVPVRSENQPALRRRAIGGVEREQRCERAAGIQLENRPGVVAAAITSRSIKISVRSQGEVGLGMNTGKGNQGSHRRQDTAGGYFEHRAR